MNTHVKSLLERARRHPLHLAVLMIAVIVAIALLWWLLRPAASTLTRAPTHIKTVTSSPIQSPIASLTNPASATIATSEITTTSAINAIQTAPISVAKTPLPTDPALAAEELDRLSDEQTRLKERKAQLLQQLEMSNKLLALKEQQLKPLETSNH